MMRNIYHIYLNDTGYYIGSKQDLRRVCKDFGIDYHDCLIGIIASAEHVHNNLLITRS